MPTSRGKSQLGGVRYHLVQVSFEHLRTAGVLFFDPVSYLHTRLKSFEKVKINQCVIDPKIFNMRLFQIITFYVYG